MPAAAACLMRLREHLQALGVLGVDAGEHHQRLEAQVAAPLAQLLRLGRRRIGRHHGHAAASPSSRCDVPQATYS